ncbi:MAG: ABC transporter substrate-binding protein [Desulfobacula sp.]|nr:ABC transporter substrate-binding protein [Desulfobacula sp.]
MVLIIAALVVLIGTNLLFAETITDNKGRKIIFGTPYSRIISLYGAHTENLFFIGCQKQVIGVSVNDTYPKDVHKKIKFSYHDGPEKFIAFKPDLVLIRPMIDNGYPKLVQRLEKSGITVVSLQPGSIDKMYDYWLTLGKLTGHLESAAQMVDDFKQKIKTISALTNKISPKKRVYFEAIHTRMKTFTQNAMPIFALETAGGINVAADAKASRNTNIAIYGKERILSKAARIDVFLAQKGVMNAVTIDQIKKEPGFKVIKAVKSNQIYLIDEDIVSRPVPRLYKGVITIGRLLYPDIFTKAKY